jgi:spore germination protein YaaH
VAPYDWVWQVIGYARSTMPPAKVELGMPAYGYDWGGGGATSLTARAAAQLAATEHVHPTWDRTQAEETFRYRVGRQTHTVWYEDATAEYNRARLALLAGFAGVDLWAAGGEDPAVWPMLRRLYGG